MKVYIKYKDSQALRDTPLEQIFESGKFLNVLQRNKMKTLGDVCSLWEHLGEPPHKGGLQGLGQIKAQHIKAIIFAYLCEQKAIDVKQEVEIIQ